MAERFDVVAKSASFEQTFNALSLQLEKAATAQIIYFIYHEMKEFVTQYSDDADCKRVLVRLCILFGASEVTRSAVAGYGWNSIVSNA